MLSSILVIGLGELGEEVVKSLATHPERGNTELAVLLRSKKPEQLQKFQDWNAKAVFGDVVRDSQDDLAKIFAQYDTVICCTGMYAPPETQIKIVKAALAAGVSRYFPWQFGIDYDIVGRNSSQDLFDSQLDVRELLRAQSKTAWVIVSTGMFISFLFEPAFGLVNAERNVVTGIGRAEIALGHPEVQGVVYTASDTISMRHLADVVERVTGRQVTRELKTVEDLKAELAEDPDDGMRKYRVVFGEGKGVAWRKEESFNGVHGIETQTVEEWARQNLK